MARKKNSNLVEFTKRKMKRKEKKFPIFNVETKPPPRGPFPPKQKKKPLARTSVFFSLPHPPPSIL
jgi:hypothetical protein